MSSTATAIAHPTDECVTTVLPEAPLDLFNLLPFQWFWVCAFVCVCICIVSSVNLVWQHMNQYRKPDQQRNIIRILLMAPVYATCSFLSLRFYNSSVYFDAVRSCYEAVVIYSFYSLMLSYIGTGHDAQKEALQKKPDGKWAIPFCCIWYNPRSGSFLKACTRGTLQYMFVNPISKLIQVIMESNGTLCYDSFSTSRPMFWLTMIEMTSVTAAMYFLIMFYVVAHDDLLIHKPVLKFISVKFVLFFSFWQSVFLSILANSGFIKETPFFTVSNVSNQIQNFLICIEMIIACILHIYAFRTDVYEGEQTSFMQGLKDIVMPTDLINDTKNALKVKRKKKKVKKIEMDPIQKTAGPAKQAVESPEKKKPVKKKADNISIENQSLINKDPEDDEFDIGEMTKDKRKAGQETDGSIDTASDMESGDEEIDGVGIIRMNPNLDFKQFKLDDDE